MNKQYDIAILGSGPGGFSAALKASEYKLKACLIEKESLGGTCLNWGCIPTKAFSHTAEFLSVIKKSASFGINTSSYEFDYKCILSRKQDIVGKLGTGAKALLQSKGVDIIFSQAKLCSADTVETSHGLIKAKNIVIATGSVPFETDNLIIDHRHIISSKDLLALQQLPKKLIIIGGGFIGCEFASIYSTLGVEIFLVELMDQILPGFDAEIAKRLEAVFKASGIKVFKGSEIVSVKKGAGIEARLKNNEVIKADCALLSIGRRPSLVGIDCHELGIHTHKGAVTVDDYCRTNIENIYAVGDVAGKYQLAHTASYEGAVAVSNIANKNIKLDYKAVPMAVFTMPQIAHTGMSIQEANKRGIKTLSLKLPFAAVSKAHIIGETEGFIKLLLCQNTRKILGAIIYGAMASELISNYTIAVKHSLTVDDISDTIFAHPTLSESFLDIANSSRKHIIA
jgi:dihydrolipoamide dehydrogenase